MVNDIFKRLESNKGPIGKYADLGEDYFFFPKLEGDIGPKMNFKEKQVLNWSLNDYLGLSNHPEVKQIDVEAALQFGAAYPMGARMMSGNSKYHIQLEKELAKFTSKESAYLLNFGYQGMLSMIDALVSKNDAIVYDADVHACIIDGIRFKPKGNRFMYRHNDLKSIESNLKRATSWVTKTGGGILFITEGIFGMQGQQGKLKEIVALKAKYNFRLLVDDAHGFGVLGKSGAGTGEAQNCQEGIDIYFSTFTKSMASSGAFVASSCVIINYLKYNIRSQIFSKALPMIQTVGALKRLELLKKATDSRKKLFQNTSMLQNGLKEIGYYIGKTTSPITPVYIEGDIAIAMNLVNDLRENYGIFVSFVGYPVVPKNIILLRIIPTVSHTFEDIKQTLTAFKAIKSKLTDGSYHKKTDEY